MKTCSSIAGVAAYRWNRANDSRARGSSAMLGAMTSMAAPSNMYGAISSDDSISASAGVAQG